MLALALLFLGSGAVFAAATAQIQKLQLPLCKGLGFSHTILPNRLGQTTQEEIGRELAKFGLLAEHACAGYFKTFLCSLHVPLCNSSACTGILHDPCRDLCMAAKDECEPVMSNLGFTYPKAWSDCRRFPITGNCMPKDGPKSIKSEPNEVSRKEPTADQAKDKKSTPASQKLAVVRNPDTLVKEPKRPKSWGVWLNITMCQGVGYYFTKLPNKMGENSQVKINEKLDRLLPLAESACSQDFRRFLCSRYARLCSSESCTEIIDGPCRSLCETARYGCERHLNRLGYDYPKDWGNCAQFSEQGKCMPAWDPPPPPSTTTSATTSTKPTTTTTPKTTITMTTASTTTRPRRQSNPGQQRKNQQTRKLNVASARTIVRHLTGATEEEIRFSDDTSEMRSLLSDLRKLIDRLERVVRLRS